MQLSPTQIAISDAVANGQNMLITGAAGTGKTTLLKALRRQYGADLPVTASTGIAAVQIRGTTLHSWAGLGLGQGTAEQIAQSIVSRNATYQRVTEATRLAIDEISMISGALFTKLDWALRLVRKRDRPFGGLQVILLGDFAQLPPVAKSREDYDCLFAFQSPSWSAADIKVAELTEIFRQEDKEFAAALSDIRRGDITERVRELLSSRSGQTDPDSFIVPVDIHTHNDAVDRANHAKLLELPGEMHTFEAIDDGTDDIIINALKKSCLAPDRLYLKRGAQVMLLKNINVKDGLANGSMGIVCDFCPGGIKVEFRAGVSMIGHAEWSVGLGPRHHATRRQFPLRLAYAVTTHKSQGQTLDKIRVYLSRCFAHGQAYVAMSRARTKAGLFIEDLVDVRAIQAHPDATHFYDTAERLPLPIVGRR